jgi:hypothetical protein
MKVTLGEAPSSFDMGFGLGKRMMFFGDGHGLEDEDVDVFFNMDHNEPHKMMKQFRFHDNELEDEMDGFRKELKELKAELKKLKKDS